MAAHGVDDHIRAGHCSSQTGLISQVNRNWTDHLTKVTAHSGVCRSGTLFSRTVGQHYLATGPGQQGNQVTGEEAAGAEEGDDEAVEGGSIDVAAAVVGV